MIIAESVFIFYWIRSPDIIMQILWFSWRCFNVLLDSIPIHMQNLCFSPRRCLIVCRIWSTDTCNTFDYSRDGFHVQMCGHSPHTWINADIGYITCYFILFYSSTVCYMQWCYGPHSAPSPRLVNRLVPALMGPGAMAETSSCSVRFVSLEVCRNDEYRRGALYFYGIRLPDVCKSFDCSRRGVNDLSHSIPNHLQYLRF